ncbi:pirin family protein [Rhodococcus sp. G-MC3]|uniref:pirin family protein n=1 Tax=Rhodococcus sp. G-MC3 TaxID=3046209 RepID=UPI0024BAFC4E|nr:pirin family protein [Rhodococcus sp. G-MC3]MDJ0393778.1 pirin family protein [Rhodococcus sp. G-MC3]
MTVRRTLPQKHRTLIGAWCFADHYGPDDVADRDSPGMDVPPHPHTGLQTVSWLFSGEIEHHDSIGSHAMVLPGELNLMTAGRGISHSEVSVVDTERPSTRILHGMQLWVALPGTARFTAPEFRHYVPEALSLPGGIVRVLLGSLAGTRSPVKTFTPLLGAELVVDAGSSLTLDIDANFEHGVILDEGAVEIERTTLARAELAYLEPGNITLTIRNTGTAPARMLILGGPPFGEQVVMWWNFMGRTHDDIVAYRQAWQDESEQFGTVEGYGKSGTRLSNTGLSNTGLSNTGLSSTRLPAPELPNSVLLPRG